MEYYRTRKAPARADFEAAYWGTVVDPDGRTRNRLEERDQFLDDAKEELGFLNGLPPGRILDIGCGPGFMLSGLRAGWEKHGVEVSRFAAQHAEQYCEIHVGPVEDAQFPSLHFDVVVLYHVIEHVPDPVSMIREVHRLLKTGGFSCWAHQTSTAVALDDSGRTTASCMTPHTSVSLPTTRCIAS